MGMQGVPLIPMAMAIAVAGRDHRRAVGARLAQRQQRRTGVAGAVHVEDAVDVVVRLGERPGVAERPVGLGRVVVAAGEERQHGENDGEQERAAHGSAGSYPARQKEKPPQKEKPHVGPSPARKWPLAVKLSLITSAPVWSRTSTEVAAE